MNLSEIKFKNTREAFSFGMWIRGYIEDVGRVMSLVEQGRYQNQNGGPAVYVASATEITQGLVDVSFMILGAKVHLRGLRNGKSPACISFTSTEGTFKCLRIPRDIVACHLHQKVSDDLFIHGDDMRMFQIPPIRLVPMIPHFWSGLVAEFANPSQE